MFNNFFNPLKDLAKTIGAIPGQIAKSFDPNYDPNFNATQGQHQPRSLGVNPPALAGGQPGYYQVKPGDTSLADVSKNTGVSLQDIVNANGGQTTMPPKGSFVATQPEAAMQTGKYGPQGMTVQPGTIAPATPSASQARADRGNPYGGINDSANVVNNAFNAFQENYRLTGVVNEKLLPTAMTLTTVQALDKKNFFGDSTPVDALGAYGYSWDPKKGLYVKTGAAGSGANSAKVDYSNPRAGQVMDNKFVAIRNASGKIVWKNIKRKGNQDAAPSGPAPVAANAAGTSQTLLGLRLGSG